MRLQRTLRHTVLLKAHRKPIESKYREAIQNGGTDVAVLLLDVRDEAARAIAETSGQGDEIAARVADGRRRGCPILMTWGVPRTLAIRLLSPRYSDVAGIVAVPLG